MGNQGWNLKQVTPEFVKLLLRWSEQSESNELWKIFEGYGYVPHMMYEGKLDSVRESMDDTELVMILFYFKMATP
jgi:hypothetical protein